MCCWELLWGLGFSLEGVFPVTHGAAIAIRFYFGLVVRACRVCHARVAGDLSPGEVIVAVVGVPSFVVGVITEGEGV